jgi:hypothetical protein
MNTDQTRRNSGIWPLVIGGALGAAATAALAYSIRQERELWRRPARLAAEHARSVDQVAPPRIDADAIDRSIAADVEPELLEDPMAAERWVHSQVPTR